MNDLISKQEAIDALMAWEEDSFWDNECLKHRGEPYWVAPSDVIERMPSIQPTERCIATIALTDEQMREAFEKAKRKILAEQPEQQWILVTERLPNEDGLYLVTTSKGQVQVHVFNHNGNSEEYWTRCNKAWMPLPEPYTESEG